MSLSLLGLVYLFTVWILLAVAAAAAYALLRWFYTR